MRKFFLGICAAAVLASCNNDKKNEKTASASETTTNKTEQVTPPVNPLEKLLGSFVGAFGDNKITLLIIKATGDSVEGRSIVGGNDRPFTGTMKDSNGIYQFYAKEPGNHPDDGIFSFQLASTDPNVVWGWWKPNNTKKPIKEFTVNRKKFEYRTDVGNWPETSQRLLKEEDVENMMKEELEFMRNEIFARHGYCFKKKSLRQQFENEDWYVPNTVDIKGFLTDIEKKNIALIKRYEKYAEEFGDAYGR